MKFEQSVAKRQHIKFRRREITQKKTYNIQKTAKVWNQENLKFPDRFSNNIKITNFMQIRPVGAELCYGDGRTDKKQADSKTTRLKAKGFLKFCKSVQNKNCFLKKFTFVL